MSNRPASIRVVPRRRLWVIGTGLTALTAVATAVIGLRVQSAEATPAATVPTAAPVSVAVVVPSQVSTWDEFSGRLEAIEHVDIRPRVAGNLVTAGANAPVLTTLVSVSPIYASFDADEQIVAGAIGGLQPASKGGDALAQIGRIPVQMTGNGSNAVPSTATCNSSTTRWMRRAARCACARCSTTRPAP